MPDASPIAHTDQPDVDDAGFLPREPLAALDRFTQLNGADTLAGANACGAVSLVAAVLVTRGYAGLGALAESLKDELADATLASLRELAAGLAAGAEAATYGALAAYADVLYHRYRDADGGMPYDKLLHLLKVAGFHPPAAVNDRDLAGTVAHPGQCWPAKIAIDGGDQGDHWLLVGRCPHGLFIYDPYPREAGSQLVRPGEPDWAKYVAAIGQTSEGEDTIGFLPVR